MKLFRRRGHHLHSWPLHERLPAGFVGVSPGASLYEFQTPDGVPVRLHDMSFRGLTYQVVPPTLVLRFAYDDPDRTPPEAVATPIALFTFTGVQIWQWEDEYDLLETPVDVRGQVRGMDRYEPTNVFSLDTIDTALLWSADQCTVDLEARTEG